MKDSLKIRLTAAALAVMGAALLGGCKNENGSKKTPLTRYPVTSSVQPAANADLMRVSPPQAAASEDVVITIRQQSGAWLQSLVISDGAFSIRPQAGIVSISGDDGSNESKFVFSMFDRPVTVQAVYGNTKNSNPNLRGIYAVEGNLVQLDHENLGFDPNVSSYLLEVPHSATRVNLSWEAEHITTHTDFAVSIAPSSWGMNGAAGWFKPARNSACQLLITATALDGSMKTYEIIAVRTPDLGIERFRIGFNAGGAITDVNNPVNEVIPVITNWPAGSYPIAGLAPNNSSVTVTGEGIYNVPVQPGSSPDVPLTSRRFYLDSKTNVPEGTFIGDNDEDKITLSQKIEMIEPLAWEKTYASEYKLILYRPQAGEPTIPMARGDGHIVEYVTKSDGSRDEVHIFTVTTVDPGKTKSVNMVVSRAPAAGSVKILLIGGGGGGGRSGSFFHPGSGGGAGGVVCVTGASLTTGAYNVTVGAGGAGGAIFAFDAGKKEGAQTYNGGDSSIVGGGVSFTAKGGGGGGWHQGGNGGAGGNGGSGGGGYGGFSLSDGNAAGSGFESQGSAGGLHGDYGAAGGGGYTGVGSASYFEGGSIQGAAHGGAGFAVAAEIEIQDILDGLPGLPAEFAGGGAGGADDARATHGGGQRYSAGGVQGEPNGRFNSGGGGAGGFNGAGFNGGSGLVIIRFAYIPPP